jgi:hypothetical protein
VRFLRTLPLLALLLALPFLLSATCVTRVDQKGPTGPWSGEVTNTGSDLQEHVVVSGQILDANGKFAEVVWYEVCPFALAPGQKGYFDTLSAPTGGDFVPPFHLSPLAALPAAPYHPAPTGISYKVLQSYPEHKAILVQARNDSPNTYYHLFVCAVDFAPSGEVRQIANGGPFLGIIFRPGDVVTFPIRFDSPLDGTFLFSADSSATDIDTLIPSPPFSYSARVVETNQGRQLQVIGEVTNTSDRDLSDTWFQAYLESSPTVRIAGFVGTTYWTGGESFGSGVIQAGQKTLLAFTLPFDADDTPLVKITGIAGKTSRYDLSPVPAKAVTSVRTGPDTVNVSATLSNPNSQGLNVVSLCFTLRNAGGKVVGGQCGSSPWIEPYGSARVTQEVLLLDARSMPAVEVVAYGYQRPEPPKITPPDGLS